MYELYPYFTNDGSVGLFSPSADDIYHSTYGALTEAYEKFILPANFEKYFKKNKSIKVLDICYGIGYNTKSFINYFLEFMSNDTIGSDNINKDNCNAQIYTNNKKLYNSTVELHTNNQKLYNSTVELHTNNQKYNIYINAIDTDKILANLSPFFITGKNNIKKQQLTFKQDKIKKMLAEKTKQIYSLKTETKIILLNLLKDNIDSESENILFSKKYSKFFDRSIIDLYKFYKSKKDKYTPLSCLDSFLHNIYYKYISSSYKNVLKALKMANFNFDLNIEDARQVLQKDNNEYNYIFLDAFTPAKCPCLWTVDFFKLLYNHLDNDGMILTYSNSATIRNAFLNAGFCVGKIFSESANKFTGTIAVKNKALIKYELSEYDLGLMKTKAGIFYRDENLNGLNEAIINAHKIEVENSNLESSSKYIKNFRRNNDL